MIGNNTKTKTQEFCNKTSQEYKKQPIIDRIYYCLFRILYDYYSQYQLFKEKQIIFCINSMLSL